MQPSPFMSLFNQPAPRPSTPLKTAKKPKAPHQAQDEEDPLYKILSWRDAYTERPTPPPESFRCRETPSVVGDDQSEWGSDFQGILLDVDWESTDFEQFRRLELPPQLISNGIVFVWAPGSLVGQLFGYFAAQGFNYVENFTFVMLDRQKIPAKSRAQLSKNTLHNYFTKTAAKEDHEEDKRITEDYLTGRVKAVQEIFMERPSGYFKESQRVLYMFRKFSKSQPLELRHQRTSDAFFTIGDECALDWKSMEAVYQMIETLLIKANYSKGKELQLLELWGREGQKRKGWVTVHETRPRQNPETEH